jgi:hypothetical protein
VTDTAREAVKDFIVKCGQSQKNRAIIAKRLAGRSEEHAFRACLPLSHTGVTTEVAMASQESDWWCSLQNRFMELAREEQGRRAVITKGETLQRIDRVLRASCTYKEHPEGWERGTCLLNTPQHGIWNYTNDGISENFFERVRLCVTEAGRALPDYPKGADPEDFWLDRLYLDLLKNRSDLLFCASKKGGMILSACVASATFCSRLQRKALQESEPSDRPEQVSTAGMEADRRLKTDITQMESSPAQNSDKTAETLESKPANEAKFRNRIKKAPPQAPALTVRRARCVEKLLRELRIIRPKMYNESYYAPVEREHQAYLLFQIARRDSDVKQWIENVQDRRGLVGLAQEIAARHYKRVTLATIKTDWSHRKARVRSAKEPR